jgi:hypothetical protein
MKFRLAGSVTIPPRPRSVGGLIGWARGVNRALQELRDRKIVGTIATSKAGGGFCNFGRIITTPAEGETPAGKAIRGGIIHCGDQNFNVEPDEIDLETDGVWLVSIEVQCEVNRDDDEESIIPGILTGSYGGGAWTRTAFTGSEDYPSNTNPEVATGIGYIILPIGKLTVADGVARLEQVACGHFTIGQCAGTLSYTRS